MPIGKYMLTSQNLMKKDRKILTCQQLIKVQKNIKQFKELRSEKRPPLFPSVTYFAIGEIY